MLRRGYTAVRRSCACETTPHLFTRDRQVDTSGALFRDQGRATTTATELRRVCVTPCGRCATERVVGRAARAVCHLVSPLADMPVCRLLLQSNYSLRNFSLKRHDRIPSRRFETFGSKPGTPRNRIPVNLNVTKNAGKFPLGTLHVLDKDARLRQNSQTLPVRASMVLYTRAASAVDPIF